MSPDSDVYLFARGGLFTDPDVVLSLPAPLRWEYLAKLREDLDDEKRRQES